MKVRICYTVDTWDRLRRAINHHYGKPGLATRDEVRAWFEQNGHSATDIILYYLERAEARDEDMPC